MKQKKVFFWNSLAFSVIQEMLAIWSLVPLPLLSPAYTSGNSQFTYCWSLAWRILSITLLSMWNECNYAIDWTFFGIALFWDWNENWPFPVLWPLLSFPNLLAYWVSTFTASSFRIWNSSAVGSYGSFIPIFFKEDCYIFNVQTKPFSLTEMKLEQVLFSLWKSV